MTTPKDTEIKVPEIELRFNTRKAKKFGPITTASDAADIISGLFPKDTLELQEQFYVLFLNNANTLIGYYRHTVGTNNSTLVDLKIILATAVKSLSQSIILAHNHPSGNLKPSDQDIQLTKKVIQAAAYLDMRVLDHLIITKEGFYSLEEHGEIERPKSNLFSGILTDKHAGKKKQKVLNTKSGKKPLSLSFIRKYASLHGKVKTASEIHDLLQELQDAIREKKITWEDPYAGTIEHIQEQLVSLCEKTNGSALIQIKNSEKYRKMGLGFFKMVAASVASRLIERQLDKHLDRRAKKKKQEARKTKRKEKPVPPPEPQKESLDGFVRADQREQIKTPGSFQLPGPIGEFLQEIQPYKYSIAITGDPHAGKTEFVTQLVDAFADVGKRIGFFSIEQGGLESKDTRAAIDRNVKKENQSKVQITGEAKGGLETLKKYASEFDVIVVDSWQKLGIPSSQFDSLRQEFPSTIWIIIFQQNAQGGTRGGVRINYDTPVLLKVHRVNHRFVNNYVEPLKNRGNSLEYKYMIASKKTIKPQTEN